jgi:hypothetical protein
MIENSDFVGVNKNGDLPYEFLMWHIIDNGLAG